MGKPEMDLHTQNMNTEQQSNSRDHENIYNAKHILYKKCKTDLPFVKLTALQIYPTSGVNSYNVSSKELLPINCLCHTYNTRRKVCTYCTRKLKIHSDSNMSNVENSGANKFILAVNNVKNDQSCVETTNNLLRNKKIESSKEKTMSSRKKPMFLNGEFPSDLPLSEVIKMFEKDKEDIKAEILRNGRTLRVCLERIVLYDKNSNVINAPNKTSELQETNLNRNTHLECNMDASVADLKLHWYNECIEYKKSVIQTKNDIKKQQHNNDIRYRNQYTQCTESIFEKVDLSKYNKSLIDQEKNSPVLLDTYSHKNVKETPIITKIPALPKDKLQTVNDKESNKMVQFCNDKCTSFVLNNNYSSKHTEKRSLGNIQESTKKEKGFYKRSIETYNSLHRSNGSTSLQKQKRLNNDESNTINNVKKIKLVRTNWHKVPINENETNDTNKNPDIKRNVAVSNTTANVSQISQSAGTLNIPNLRKSNEVRISDSLVTKGNLNKTQSISNTSRQTSVKTYEYGNISCDTQNNITNLQDLVTETSKSFSKSESLVSSQTNSNDESFMTDEDDCISLFADSELLEEYNIPEIPVQKQISNHSMRNKKSYKMTDKVFDNYYKKCSLEFKEAYQANNTNNNNISQKEKQLLCPTVKIKSDICSQSPQTHKSTEVVNKKKPAIFFRIFRGYCHQTLQSGSCSKSTTCRFSHQFLLLMTTLYIKDEQYFFEVIDNLISQNCGMFLKRFYNECLIGHVDIIFTLKVLKKLYNTKIITNEIASKTITQLKISGTTMNVIVNRLAAIVDINDTKFVMDILIIVLKYVPLIEYWPTMKPLLMKVKKLELQVIHILLCQCLIDKTYVKEIYDNIICKLSGETRRGIDKRTLSLISNIFKETKGNTLTKNTKLVGRIRIASADPTNVTNEPKSLLRTNNDVNAMLPKVWKNDIFGNKTNTQNKSSPVLVHSIDNLPNAYSVRATERFKKFYGDAYNLQKGLEQNDYKHVKEILDAAQQNEVCPYSRTLYNILRKEVERAEYHLSMLGLLAAQTGASSTFYKIFNDVTIHILATLAEKELWVLAHKLLKNIEITLHEENSLCKFDAGVLLLFAEIYLANRKPLKAFTILKQSNIIYTHRGKWKVPNNIKDDHVRAKIVTLLLDMLCTMSPTHAYFLFEFLIMNQNSNFYPIDLSNCVNKVIPSILSNNDHDLIVNVGNLIDQYNCTPNTITYRTLISSLVPINLTLAKQLYECAVLLGIYPKIQFHPVVYVIVRSDWTSDEMYLTILILIQQILRNAGHAISGISPRQCSVYLLFENIPSEEQLVYDEGINKLYEIKIKQSKMLMKKVLEEQFEPPLSLVSRKKGKLQKINSINLHRYLHQNQNSILAD